MILYYLISISSLSLIASCSEVKEAESSKVLVDAELLNRLLESLEYKNGHIDSLLNRVDRLEQREWELQSQNEKLLARIEKLESRDQPVKVFPVQENGSQKGGDTAYSKFDNSSDEQGHIRVPSDGNSVPSTLKTRQASPTSGYEGSNIAFFAGITNHLQHQGKGQLIVFDRVITNIGNAYNPHSGDFRAPISGTYVFSVNLMAYSGHTTHYYFAKNGSALAWLYLRGTESPYTSSSQTIVVELNQGDDVSIKNYDSDEMLHGSMYSTFSGFLLREKFNDVVIG